MVVNKGDSFVPWLKTVRVRISSWPMCLSLIRNLACSFLKKTLLLHWNRSAFCFLIIVQQFFCSEFIKMFSLFLSRFQIRKWNLSLLLFPKLSWFFSHKKLLLLPDLSLSAYHVKFLDWKRPKPRPTKEFSKISLFFFCGEKSKSC